MIEVESLEAAEMIKLMNNTFRDVVFSFANEAAYIADQFNLNAFSLIRAANEGYPRNEIPSPSPGVGGYCLTKDPFLYGQVVLDNARSPYQPKLGNVSRTINSHAPRYVFRKLQAYCDNTGKRIEEIKVYVIGIAFKGVPETSDIRYSPSIDLIECFPDRTSITVFDHVVPETHLRSLKYHVVSNIEDGFDQADAVLIMNNHRQNNKFNLYRCLGRMKERPLVFDGWNMLIGNEVEKVNQAIYATMGYMTDSRSYYKIISLKKDEEIFVSGSALSVNCDFKAKEIIENDDQFNALVNEGRYFWVSGGGTYFINKRHLVVVERESTAKINGNRLSLFTGRAENVTEWEQPLLLERELFEELWLYENNVLLIPDHPLAERVYSELRGAKLFATPATARLSIEKSKHLTTQSLEINGTNYTGTFCVNANNDVNVLHLYEINVDTNNLSAEDGESHCNGREFVRHNRRIYLWDIWDNELLDITRTEPREKKVMSVSDARLTDHLKFLRDMLKSNLR